MLYIKLWHSNFVFSGRTDKYCVQLMCVRIIESLVLLWIFLNSNYVDIKDSSHHSCAVMNYNSSSVNGGELMAEWSK